MGLGQLPTATASLRSQHSEEENMTEGSLIKSVYLTEAQDGPGMMEAVAERNG